MATLPYIRIVCVLFLVFRFRLIYGRSDRRCERIAPLNQGNITYTADGAYFSCHAPYSLFPDIHSSNCTESLEWKPEPPKCMKNVEVKVPRNGFLCGGNKNIIRHTESFSVCCNRGYELYSDRFLDRAAAKITNRNGAFDPEVPSCKEERCDPAGQYMTDVHHKNGSKIDTKVLSRTSVYLSCKEGFEYYSGDQAVMRTCVKGVIKNAPICREAKCLFSGIPTNSYTFHREYLADAQLVAEDQLLHPNDTVEVFCLNTKEYELYVNTAQTYVEEFTSKCRFGNFDKKKEDFPICVESRCSFNVSSDSCYWIHKEDKCLPETFTIQSQSSVNVTCRDRYKLLLLEEGQGVKLPEKASTFCYKGVTSPVYECIPVSEKCSVPAVEHARLQSKTASIYENGETISFACDKKEFHFYQNISTKSDVFNTTCNLGNWTDNIPNECKPDGCKLNILEGYRYIAGNAKEISANELIEHRKAVDLQCSEMFDLFDKNDRTFLDKEYKPTVACYQGTWQNEHFCRKRCVVHNVANERFIKDGKIVKSGETVVHGETVSVQCDGVVYDSVPTMKCLNGEWQNTIVCPGEIRTSPVSPTETTTKTTTISTGCRLPDNPQYTYSDTDGSEIEPGSFISEGTVLTVSCYTNHLYEYYEYDTIFYEDQTTVTCTGNELSDFDLQCKEHACLELQNGSVRFEDGYFYVFCNKGYSLNLIEPNKNKCTCENGNLRSVYGGQEPKCVPDKCVVPYEIDERLSVTDSFGAFLSGGSVVEIGSFVYFNCSKAVANIYEPLNRRFRCSNGLWLEAERDIKWKLGFNGEFPICREAICVPKCENGGVCFKDDNCRCKHLTGGKRCGKFICDNDCIRKDGECTGPGQCSCKKERSGPNCEQINCVVPNNIDEGLSIMDKNVSLGHDVIQSGTFVHFNCFKKCSSGYEPSNRRFQCINGRWTEAENDKSWQLGNNGTFPKCREALCTPDCVNGGICFKDNNCICRPFTGGHRCEKFVCDDKCSRNGGTCIGPRDCSCPEGQSGPNCEHRVWSAIIGGSNAKISDHPYQVSLQDSYGRHICGASILNNKWVLTAAHCVESVWYPWYLWVSLNDGTLSGSSAKYRVFRIVVHDRYNKGKGAFPNDIALLQLGRSMNFRTYGHKPIRLASKYQNFANSKCSISGWGLTEGGNFRSGPDKLQAATGTILTHRTCEYKWRSWYNRDVHICIQGIRSGACQGDSGGPMVCDGVLAGVTSFGEELCLTSLPSVYTRVSNYREWIERYIS